MMRFYCPTTQPAGYIALRNDMIKGITLARKQCSHCHTIWFTGHSLGAAISGLAAFDMSLLLDKSQMKLSLSNYGMPRVGNKRFSELYKQQGIEPSWRNVHYRDIVPHLPPRWLFGAYHIADEIWYYNEAGIEWKEGNGSGEDPSLSDSGQ
jgi:predicted lipase